MAQVPAREGGLVGVWNDRRHAGRRCSRNAPRTVLSHDRWKPAGENRPLQVADHRTEHETEWLGSARATLLRRTPVCASAHRRPVSCRLRLARHRRADSRSELAHAMNVRHVARATNATRRRRPSGAVVYNAHGPRRVAVSAGSLSSSAFTILAACTKRSSAKKNAVRAPAPISFNWSGPRRWVLFAHAAAIGVVSILR